MQAVLALADGTIFEGIGIGAPGQTTGEVVFNTAMTGYQEILTDPSYSGQLVTLTYPHIGNTGVNPMDQESDGPKAAGLIVRDCPPRSSSWRATASLPDWLRSQGVVAISDIDTRHLTRLLRDGGAQAGCIQAGETVDADAALAAARACPDMRGQDLARTAGVAAQQPWTQGRWDLDAQAWRESGSGRQHVVVMDFGVKQNILRMLRDLDCRVTLTPPRSSAEEILGLRPDGILAANGPGDPEPCGYAVETLTELLQHPPPLFGICLGHQLLGLALGGRTIKMKFGHHGANHPVQDLDTGQVLITSQNHGFAVDPDSLPDTVVATHRSLFDGSLQGIRLRDRPVFGFQGHPEASPGPHDLHGLFDRFTSSMAEARD